MVKDQENRSLRQEQEQWEQKRQEYKEGADLHIVKAQHEIDDWIGKCKRL